MRRFLIVANQTLGGDALMEAARQRLREGPSQFWVLVPATSPAQLAPRMTPGGSALPPAGRGRQESGEAAARRRLGEGLARLRELGADADGQVGVESPLDAIEECLSHREFDEIILSTLPLGVSRWLRQDLPSRIRRKYNLPVTHIESPLPDPMLPHRSKG